MARNGCRGRNTGQIVACVFLFVSFGMVIRGGFTLITYDQDAHDKSTLTVGIIMLAVGLGLTAVSAILCVIAIYKYKQSSVASATPVVTVMNPQLGCNRNMGYNQRPPAHIQPIQRQPPPPNRNTQYPPTANLGYPPMQNSYPPPNQNPAFLNPAYLPDPPPYAPPGNDPVYPPPGGNLYGNNNNYGGGPPQPSAPPPSYDVITTGQPFNKGQ